MFFADHYQHFFRPLTGKYREQVVECLRLLYERLYTAKADYGESLTREQILEIFSEALTRAPQLDDNDDGPEGAVHQKVAGAAGAKEHRFRNLREQAVWVLNSLAEYGWLEKQVDSATLVATYPFSRRGRLFTQPLVEVNSTRVRTRHRNTRNTLNALEAFAGRGEIHDLIDAWEYSERIVADFTDMIAELEERKRELVREVEAQLLVQQATDEFFSFMESRFQPDLAIRLSADSVEKHRDAIGRVIARIRRKEKSQKAEWERRLRQLLPDFVEEGRSLLWWMLDTIEDRMRRACEVKLPALRHALHGFTKRADIIIRQLSYLHSQSQGAFTDLCQQLGESAERNALLTRLGQQMGSFQLRLFDPKQTQLWQRQRRQPVNTRVEEEQPLAEDNRREILLQQMLDQAFNFNSGDLRDYLQSALGSGRRINSRDLPLDNARDLLAMSHALEAAAVNQGDGPRIAVEFTGETASNDYFAQFDEYYLELKDSD
ncbi:flagellar protein FliT [Microbulbifer flavimaris]|uniref:Flagellar protein FliT n=1 Tax=Microbulbifer flavimaris TaxID=1781068 RepID=A0ABX4I3P6_9GAMM|nr:MULTISPECIES: Wadjet anti-phage system protein JetA family protein [Microbulbifer]KUJ84939.1 ferrochelatase [Microbulbifer sp. ZGT114]PCO07042.1 flagellar protein FliT [Microbulbifer flavimaris]